MKSKTKKTSENKYVKKALEFNDSGLVVFDFHAGKITIVYLSAGFFHLIASRQENRRAFVERKVITSIPSEDRDALIKAVGEATAQGTPLDVRYRIQNGKGEYLWIGLRAGHENIAPGIERFYGTYSDVDVLVQERKRTTEILENVPSGVSLFVLPEHGVILKYANPSFFRVHDWDEAFWKSHTDDLLSLVHPNDRPLFLDRVVALKKGQISSDPLTYRSLGKDGRYHWVSTRFSFAFNDGPDPAFYVSSVNIDRRIAAEEEAERVRLVYETSTKDMRIVLWEYDVSQNRAIFMTEGYTGELCRKLGWPTVLENVPESLLPYVHPADREPFLNAYREIQNGALESHAEFRFNLPNVEGVQYEKMSFRRIYSSDGVLLGIFGSAQNVTALRLEQEKYERAREALQGPQYYASFRLNITQNICWNGTLGKSQAANVNLADLQGSGTVDGYFQAFERVIADEAIRADFRARFRRDLIIENYAKGINSIAIDYPFIYQNGERHWRQGTIALMRNPTTGDIEGVAYSTDIDQRMKGLFLLKDLGEHNFDYIGLIHLNDRTFEFLTKNEAIPFGEIGVRIPYEDCVRYVRSLWKDPVNSSGFKDIDTLEQAKSILTKQNAFSRAYTIVSKGQLHCYQIHYSWFEKPGGDILVVRSDVTEAYQKEQNLIQRLHEAKNEAERANEAKSDFLSRMSHDIRTPLNGIIGLTYLALEMDLPADAKANLQKIDTSSKFLLGLVNDILDMAKAESGKLELHPEPYSAEDFQRYIEAVATPLSQSRYQQFSFMVDPILHDRVPLMDKLRINQIAFNLISNASKYSPEGSLIAYRVSEKALPKMRMAMHVEVQDNGIGMSKAFQKRLFVPFAQESGSDRAEMRGTGLGLAITKKLVDAMGGSISARSELKKGSTFVLDFVWNCVSPAEAKVRQPKTATALNLTRLNGKRILLCEDNAINQEIAKKILTEKGLDVTIAKNGKDGLRLFDRSSRGYYSAILMDVRMPVMDGIEATKAIRALPRSDAQAVPIIAMTADAFAEDAKRCAEAGMNAHLPKPIEPAKVFEMLLSFIA